MSLTQQAHALDLTRVPAGVALLGCGTVGGGVAHLLLDEAASITAQAAQPFLLNAIVVRHPERRRQRDDIARLLTTDAQAVIDDPNIAIIVETIGGTSDAARLVEQALRNKKHVVTANKDLLATDGPRLLQLAAEYGVSLQYEAAVGGAIPIVRTIAESLAGETILEVGGVLNGTTNFILSAMVEGADYAGALAEAQALGYAEADPTSDVEGADAAHKLAILAQLAFGRPITSDKILRRGITTLTRDDLTLAQRMHYAIKLLAFARNVDGRLSAMVTPAFVNEHHSFAQPTGPQNCIRVVGKSSGSLTFAGSGAGREATASAIVGDIVAALRRIAASHLVLPGGALPTSRLATFESLDVDAVSLRRVVRFGSFIDARPAEQLLIASGTGAKVVDGSAALVTDPLPLSADGSLWRSLQAEGLVVRSILPVWSDVEPKATGR